MNRKIKKVAVLGAGIMGSRIAALLAGVNIPTYLLDIVPKELDDQDIKKGLTKESPNFRNKLAKMGIQGTIGTSPPAMFMPEDAKIITPGNFEDHLQWLADIDWIIEAVAEDLEIKKTLLNEVEKHKKPTALLSTNTSGLSIDKISENLSDETKTNFLGTHFFNPPRHMKLLEMIPGKSTDKNLVAFIADFCEKQLGKSVVFAKDTPNFIANRIGAYSSIGIMNTMIEDGYTIEEVDAITGPPMGRPKSASFRTSDMVGLDTFLKVAENVRDNIEDETEKKSFTSPLFVKQMVGKGLLGDKTQQGFYKKVLGAQGTEIHTLDLNIMEYVPQRKPDIPALSEINQISDPAERIQKLVYSEDRAGILAWKVLKRMLLYCAEKVPEISDDILSIDQAMKWGFNWELGPFEVWDAIGVKKSVERMKQEGENIPPTIRHMVASGIESFYVKQNMRRLYYNLMKGDYILIEDKPQIILLPSLKERDKVIKSNSSASLVDMEDGIACLEFHSKSNAIDPDIIQMINDSITEVEENFEGMVIGNNSVNFCVGADLRQILPAAQNKEWDKLEQAVKDFQQACMRIKYAERPVVVAPFRMTLGGGCEVCMAAAAVRAYTECYMGQVEMGVGLIPGGGGNKEMLFRATDWVPKEVPSAVPGGGKPDLMPYIARTFETIAMAKISSCAREAHELNFLKPHDTITMNPDFLLNDAKHIALTMANDRYRPPRPRNEIRVPGRTGRAMLELFTYLLREGLYISDHDFVITNKLAFVLTGGDVDNNTLVTEEYLLDIEREAFLSLCGEEKTQDRMEHMLRTNKPLRN